MTTRERSYGERLAPGERFRLIFETTFQFTGLLDADGTMLEVNRSALSWVRSPREAAVGHKVWDTPWWIPAGDAVIDRLKAAVAAAQQGQFVRYDVTLPSVDGLAHTFDFSLTPIADDTGTVVLIVAEGRDITEQKRLEHALRETNRRLELAQEQARQLAITDELTGLHNRRGFFLIGEQLKQLATRKQGRGLLMFIDIDSLKRANDDYGHDAGDALIVAAATVLARTFRASDVVARLGGDEFAVLASLSGEDSAATVADRLAANLDALNRDAKLCMPLQVSTGTHEFAWADDLALEVLVSRADAAMYEGRARNK